MMLGMSLSAFTTLHVVISLMALAAGFATVRAMLAGRIAPRWTALFLATTILTSMTGFGFPATALTPGHIFGFASLAALGVAVAALYFGRLHGWWRPAYVVTALIAFYLNAFVAVLQAFLKIGFLHSLAPTQAEPPFAIAQIALLAAFAVIGFMTLRRFHPPLAAAGLAAAPNTP